MGTATAATGGSASSQAVTLDRRVWNPRPGVGLAIRLAVIILPIAAGITAVRLGSWLVPRPDGRPFWVWISALVVVSCVASLGMQRALRRVAPLALLFKMSLVFPDEAPSRFAVALRAGTFRSLVRRVQGATRVQSYEQAASEHLVTLIAQLGRHDRLTTGHSERVRAYAVMLGEEIGLPPAELEKLNWAALAHDIGKLQVPAEILNKASHPTDDEWMVLRAHPWASWPYVEPMRPWLGDWIDAATQHHERYDGTGYPRGLAGNDISLAGRIVAIADAYDVMTAVRSYKKPLPPAQARAELTRNSGTQFDPHLVRSFLQISLGRMRRVVGPLGVLSQFPNVVRAPLTAALTTTNGFVAAGAIGLAVAAGVISPVPPDQPTTERTASPFVPAEADSAIFDAVGPPVLGPGTAPGDAGAPRVDSGVAAGVAAGVAPGSAPVTTVPPPSERSPLVVPAERLPGPPGDPAPSPAAPRSPAADSTSEPLSPVVAATPTSSPPVSGVTTDDEAATRRDTKVSVHVLQNDSFDGSGPDIATLQVIGQPTSGTVHVSGQNLLYDPTDGFTGTDTMSYRVCSLSGACGEAVVTVAVR